MGTDESVGTGSVTSNYFSGRADTILDMPSKRRQLLYTLSVAAVGIAGCNSVLPNEREGAQTATPSDTGTTTSNDTPAPAPNEQPTFEAVDDEVETPVTIVIRNRHSAPLSVRLTLAIEPPAEAPQVVHDQSHEVADGERIQIAEFDQHGQYHFTVEMYDEQYGETTYVSRNELEDCMSTFLVVNLETGISLGGERVYAGGDCA